MKITKLNESYSCIEDEPEVKIAISNLLSVKDPKAQFDIMVKRGLSDGIIHFAFPQNGALVVLNGHLPLIKMTYPKATFETDNRSEFKEADIDTFYKSVLQKLPFEPYDFQHKAFRDSLLANKQINIMSTSSGKSLTITMMCEFLRQQGKRGLLLVPNITLLSQFKGDIKDYNLQELYDSTRVIGGGETVRAFDTPLTISTWQSLQGYEELVNDIDYIICDELQYYASDVTSEIVTSTFNCKMKIGFTGTLPEDNVKKMTLLGLFGFPKTYITPRQLIDRGLATPISIKALHLNYTSAEFADHAELPDYHKKLAFIKEHPLRNRFIVELLAKLRKSGMNTLCLFQHTDHGKLLFTDLMKIVYPDVVVLNKNITGKKSFEFQSQYGIYFLNGEDDAKTRELTRKILELHPDATIISNYALMSTGANIKRLHNAVLASPLKSYTAITQTIGRGMRLFDGKYVFNVFDIVDNLSPFKSQYKHRLKTSYNREEHPVTDHKYNLEAYFQDNDW